MYVMKVHGPPGTGKTTELLRIMAEQGDTPSEVGFVSFTRAAVREAWKRCGVTSQQDAPYMRTLHSLCYQATGKPPILRDKDLKEFGGKRYQFSTHKATPEAEIDEIIGAADATATGEAYLRFNKWARNRRIPYDGAFDEFPHPGERLAMAWGRRTVLRFCEEYDAFRKDTGLCDFTSMLELALASGYVPPVRSLYVDEAQDLSVLQFDLVRHWATNIPRTVLAGDADQAIYEFQGAEPRLFLDFPADEERTLNVSYRLPRAILQTAQALISRNIRRKSFAVEPRGEGGRIRWFNSISDLSSRDLLEGRSTFILARNIYLLKEVDAHLRQLALPYIARRGAPAWHTKERDGVLALWHLHRGNPISGKDLQALANVTESKKHWKWGSKKTIAALDAKTLVRPGELPLHGAMPELMDIVRDNRVMALSIKDADRAVYIRDVLEKRGESALVDPPRITTGTMHCVKGQEADTVLLLTGMSKRTYEGWWRDPEPERRVFYVGVTRARHTLWIQTPLSRGAFNEL